MAVNLSPVGGAAAQFFDNSGQVLTGGKLYTYSAGTTTPAVTYTTSTGVTAHPNPIIFNAAGRVPDSGEIWLTDSLLYKFVLKDQNDVLIATWDNIDGINSNFVNYNVQSQTIVATQGQTAFTLTTVSYTPNTNTLSVYVNGSKQIISLNYVETDSTHVTFIDGLNVGDVVDFTTASTLSAGVTDASLVTYNEGGTGAVTYNVEQRLQQFVTVKDFGATGDGTTDDTLAIQAAIDSGAQNIYFPQGTYAISAPLQLIPFTQLIGVDGGNTSGSSSSRIFALSSFTGDAMILSTDAVDISGEKRYGLKNLFLNGANYVKNGVWWKNTSSGQIFNVSVVNVREYGFRIANGATGYGANVTLENCYVRMPNDQFFIDPVNYPIYAAYYIEGVFQVLINCLSDGGQAGYWQGANGNVLTGQNVIQNCHFEGWTKHGIRLSDNNGVNQVIANEIISIYDISNTHGVTIQVGVYLDPTASAGSNVISQNIILNPANGATYVDASFGILTGTYSANNIISNNVIRNFVNGIVFQSSFNTTNNNSINTTQACYGFSTGASGNLVDGGLGIYSTGYLVNNTSGNETNKVTNLVTTDAAQQTYNNITALNHPPVFSVYQNTTQSIPNLTDTTVIFDTKEFDNYLGFNTTTGVYSAPVSGYYQINSTVELTATTSAMTLSIYVQGSLVKQNTSTVANTTCVSINAIVYLQKGWSMQIEATLVGPKSTSTGVAKTWVSGCLTSTPF